MTTLHANRKPEKKIASVYFSNSNNFIFCLREKKCRQSVGTCVLYFGRYVFAKRIHKYNIEFLWINIYIFPNCNRGSKKPVWALFFYNHLLIHRKKT